MAASEIRIVAGIRPTMAASTSGRGESCNLSHGARALAEWLIIIIIFIDI